MSDMKKSLSDTAEKKLRNLIEGQEQLFPQQLAERFPYVLQKVVALWLKPEQERDYFQELLVTYRENRQGFPTEVYSEIYALSEFYDQRYPPVKNTKDNFWTWFKQ